MDPFTITAIIGLASAAISYSQAEKARKEAKAQAKRDEEEARRIRENTRFEEEPAALGVGASREATPLNPLASLQIGL